VLGATKAVSNYFTMVFGSTCVNCYEILYMNTNGEDILTWGVGFPISFGLNLALYTGRSVISLSEGFLTLRRDFCDTFLESSSSVVGICGGGRNLDCRFDSCRDTLLSKTRRLL
jgi:hypothetical protein